MRHRDYVAEREARDPAFKAAREALRPQREWQRALIRARIEAGLTQHELAERLGTKQSAIARWESGRVCPTVDTLSAWATATGGAFWVGPGSPACVQYAAGPATEQWLAWLQQQTAQMQSMMQMLCQWQVNAPHHPARSPRETAQAEEPRRRTRTAVK